MIITHGQMFYSLLTGKKYSGKEHEHVLKVWNTFQKKTIKDYHDLGVINITEVRKNLFSFI